ncbi:unnamed protein product [Rotaria magnacalcarata]|uniref:Calcineurin-like phosphoesterase domain-containing protein n=1 Tax=Rotaria magnacalcarata TaxID=392030 RepID=A0A819ATE1_9BILA|nr:unnamed protein product [Rotaria magnacalcarata]
MGRPDIPSLKPFLLARCERFKHIFYVAGNHCFYAGEYETHLQQLQALDNLNFHDEEAGVEDAFVNDHDTPCVDPVRLWAHGHTHRSTNLMVNSTRLASNQFGYLSENCGFRPNMKIPLYDDGTVNVTDA